MDYSKIYNNLISKAKNRKLDCYTESHHVIPECMGGPDTKENRVDLTAEEHYIAHQLLVKIYPDNHKLVFAANMMCVYSEDNIERKNTNKRHGWLRRKLSKALSDKMTGKPAWNRGIPMEKWHREKLKTTWVFTFPDGHEETHKGLTEFCKEHGLNPSAMSAVCKGRRGQHKGFKCRKLDNISEADNKAYISKPRPTTSEPVNRIAVKINGVKYPSIRLACVALGITRKKVEELNEY